MSSPSFPPARAFKFPVVALLSVLLLAGCGGSSSDVDEDVSSRQAATETPDTTAPVDVVETNEIAIPAAETAPPGMYTRALDYPHMVTLPLQFMTTAGGKKLGVVVTLPAQTKGVPAEGPFPAVLVQTAYNISLIGALPMSGGVLTGAPDPIMVKRGYAMVSVDVLGTGVSEGGWEMIGEDEQAAYGDAVDWVRDQPWFNGKLGVAGASYMGITALVSAQRRPDDVQAVFASVPLGDPLRGTVGTGGIINGVFMSHWLVATHALTVQNVPAVLLNLKHATQITKATKEHTAQIDNYYLPVIDDALGGAPDITYDGDFWRTRSPIENIDKVKAPTMILGAVNDIFQRDAPLLYERLKQNVDTRLIIYNGDHLGHFLQGYLGVNGVDPMPFLVLQWFDHYLMGMDTNLDAIPPVTQYVKNHREHLLNGFVSTTDWPHPQAVPERWYLRGGDSLSRSAPEATEVTRSMVADSFAEVEAGKSTNGGLLKFDIKLTDGTKCSPSYQQWTLGVAGILKSPSCFHNNRELEKNALNYETAPMDEDYYINGPIQADIWIDSTVTEAVLSVRVDEVSPNGRVVKPLSNGLLLASARQVDETRSRFMHGEMIQPYHFFTQEAVLPVVPGEVFKMQVEVFPTSALVRRGHKLRVSISPSNQAQGILNNVRKEQARNGVTTIHNSPEYPSSIVLPVVPLSAMN